MTLQDTTKHGRSVYLMHMVDTDYYKIGIAYDVQSRLRSIQTGSPFVITLICSFEHKNATRVEQSIFRALRDHHVRGEWFTCPPEKIRLIFNAYADSDLHTTLCEGTDANSIVTREMIEDAHDLVDNHGLRQSDIAKRLGLSLWTVHAILREKGRFKPKS